MKTKKMLKDWQSHAVRMSREGMQWLGVTLKFAWRVVWEVRARPKRFATYAIFWGSVAALLMLSGFGLLAWPVTLGMTMGMLIWGADFLDEHEDKKIYDGLLLEDVISQSIASAGILIYMFMVPEKDRNLLAEHWVGWIMGIFLFAAFEWFATLGILFMGTLHFMSRLSK